MKAKKAKTAITIRLTDEQHEILQRLCRLKNTTQTGYLTNLAAEQARKELLDYALGQYLAARASLSELATKTGLDVPTIMEAIAQVSAEDKRAMDAFLSAAKTIAKTHKDPEFYELALKAVAS